MTNETNILDPTATPLMYAVVKRRWTQTYTLMSSQLERFRYAMMAFTGALNSAGWDCHPAGTVLCCGFSMGEPNADGWTTGTVHFCELRLVWDHRDFNELNDYVQWNQMGEQEG